MWEREVLLTTFLSWKKYTSKEWKIIECKAKEVGNTFVTHYCLQRWRENQAINAKVAKRKIDIICTRQNDVILQSHFTKWFAFSRSRGKRIRKTRILWKQWKSFLHYQNTDQWLLTLAMKSIQISRKARVIALWTKARTDSARKQDRHNDQMKKIRPQLLYMLSLWMQNYPILRIECSFKAVSKLLPYPPNVYNSEYS